MLNVKKITNSVTYIGSQDPELRVFDIVMETEFGSTYNSYLIDGGEEFALIDTAKEKYFDEYFEKLQNICELEKIKYIIVNHTEPDHSGEIHKLIEKMPWVTVVGTGVAIGFLKDITNSEFKSIEVKEGFELNVGNKKLSFIIAPNLHWPDSMFTYLEEEKIIFTCDVFGAHYNTDKYYVLEVENQSDYEKAFKYYFDVIFGPFKPYVISGLNKIKNLEIHTIAPSHGPMHKENIKDRIEQYLNWSKPEITDNKKVTICYTSAYGFTETIGEKIREGIEKEGYNVVMYDLVYTDIDKALYEINTSVSFLIGTPTINADTLPNIWELLTKLSPIDCKDKLVASFGAFGWSGEGVRNVESRLSMLKCEVYRPGLRIKFNPNYSEKKLNSAYLFGKNFGKKLTTILHKSGNEEWVQVKTGKWKCLVCGEIYEGEYPPVTCPACGAPADQFTEINDNDENYNVDSDEKIVVIGSGISAISACEKLREINKTAKITVVSEEEDLPYSRIQLSKKILSDEKISYLKDENWFKENNIELRLDEKIFRVVPDKNMIIFQEGKMENYDKLIIATGASNNRFPIHGDNKKGVFDLRSKKDFEKINEYVMKDNVKDIVIVGGGILGIEMATGFKKKGKNVTIVEYSPRIMFKQIDEDGAKIFRKHLEVNGVNIRVKESVEEIYGTGEDFKEVCGIRLLHSKDKIDCQMVIISTGIKPNIELVKDTQINTNKGIVVDKHMKTNFENVFACGDVCEFNNRNIGLWANAIDQGKVAAYNALGIDMSFIQKPISVSYNGFDYNIFSIGDLGIEHDKNSYQVLELSNPQLEIYKKFYFHEDQFVGGILMGDTKKAVQLRKAIDKGTNMQSFLDLHFLDY